MAQRGRPRKTPITQVNPETEALKSANTYEDYVMNYIDGFVTKAFGSGQIKTITEEKLQKYFSNPDVYYNEISSLMTYYYISDGDIYQLYNLIQILPTLNYKINVFDTSTSYEKNLSLCNKTMYKIKYKSLIRDLLSQECVTGTVVSMWLGDKKNPYLFVFDELKYVFPKYRKNGEWVCVVDMSWFKNMIQEEKESYFNNLKPYVTQEHLDEYDKDTVNNRYVELPTDRTTCLRINTLFRNQRLGMPNGTQSLFDKLHKQTLKNLEKTIAEKVIKNIVVLKIGSEKVPEYANMKLNNNLKKKIVARVKQALTENLKDNNIPVIALPEYTDITFGDVQGLDALKKDKFEGVNNDISNAVGVSTALTNGTGSNFASSKLNLDMLYKRIGVMLEGVEDVFNKMFRLMLPNNVKDNYFIEFDKETPLTSKEKLDTLMKLHSEGMALKPIVDMIQGVDYGTYIDNTLFEIEELKLRDKVIPPLTSNVIAGGTANGSGAPTNDNPTNENTIKSKTADGNNLPSS